MFRWFSSLKNAFTGLFNVSDVYRLKIYEQKILCYNRLLLAARKHYMAQTIHYVVKDTSKGDALQQVFLDLGDCYLDSLIYSSKGVVEAFKNFMSFDMSLNTQADYRASCRLAYFALANAMREDLNVEKFHDLTMLLSDLPVPLIAGKSRRQESQTKESQAPGQNIKD